MKRLLALLAGALGLVAWLRRRRLRLRRAEPESSPADELKAKLAESRAATGEDAPEAAPEGDLEARRREVHERGRGAIDDLS